LTVDQLRARIAEANKIILASRSKRVAPTLDDKILTSWNALMIRGYLVAQGAFEKQEYFEMAIKNASFLERERVDDNGHVWRNKSDKNAVEGFLDDYAMTALAFIDLYQATFDIQWLAKARAITDFAITHFNDPESGLFYYTMNESQSLIVKKIEIEDEVIASSNSALAEVIFLLGQYYDQEGYRNIFKKMINRVSPLLTKSNPYYSNWYRLVGWVVYPPYEVAIMGPNASKINRDFRKHFSPSVILMGGEKENLPLLENKYVDGKTIIYVCKNRTCKLPVQNVEQALKQMDR
jgi:uncharacterized protein YyaL (SSP411 family)